MRIALLSDIHGNFTALEAVLEDLERRGGVDEYWILGDLVALGPEPVKVLERLSQLPNTRFTRGNTDRYVTDGTRPPPAQADVLSDAEKLDKVVQIAENFAWTQGAVTVNGWYAFLKDLPLEARTTLPDGTRLLGVHASPNTDEGSGIRPVMTDEEITALVMGCDADLICVGHTHWPFNRQVRDKHVVNLGSVSNPLEPSLKASYGVLEADESGYHFEHHQVDYDREAVIKLSYELHHPAAGYIASLLRGDLVRSWGEPNS